MVREKSSMKMKIQVVVTITRLVFTHFVPKHVTVKTDNYSEMADSVTECPLYHFIRLGR